MEPHVLDRVLACPTIPSLPTVAMRIIELTGDPDVSVDELAEAIRWDQGLSAKILRTVNSSYYGLRQRCTTIHKALVLLGMRPVKSLALGFSLIDAIDGDNAGGFDYRSYWRRALYTAQGAKAIAKLARDVEPEEAFLAGLLQDVGMVALHQALGAQYDEILGETGGDHSKLCRAELERLDIQHPDVGAMLAEGWKLPPELTLPIRYHERPTAAPAQCAALIRCVAMGNAVHDVLTDADPTPALRRLYTRGKQWFNLTPSIIDEVITAVSDSTREMTRLFRLDTGAFTDAAAVLGQAERRLVDLAQADPRATYAAEELAKHRTGVGENDPLTGSVGPEGFDRAVRTAFFPAHAGETCLSVVHVAIDGLARIDDQHGHVVRDELLIGLAALLHKHFEPMGGVVCRLGQDLFTVVLPGTPGASARAATGAFHASLPDSVNRWLPTLRDAGVRVTASIGIATLDAETAGTITSPDRLVVEATGALRAAQAAGGSAVRAFSLGRKAA